jgi:hypothetical protein
MARGATALGGGAGLIHSTAWGSVSLARAALPAGGRGATPTLAAADAENSVEEIRDK